jgi:hypothetical protein
MKLNPLVLQWSILLISLLLALVPSSSASPDIIEYHITTLTQQHSILSPPAHDPGNAAPAAAAAAAPELGPAEDMQAVYTSATNLIIAKIAVLKLGRALTTDELALSAQALAQKLQLGQAEMLEIGGLVETLVGRWNRRRGGEGGGGGTVCANPHCLGEEATS